MTVCIAAICNGPNIVGTADRLITYGDTEYEQVTPKILQLATNTVVLTSGSPEAHTTIYTRTLGQIAAVPNPSVEYLAETYANEFANLRRKQAERKYLTPLGLTSWGLLNNQTNLMPSVATMLITQLTEEELDCQAIVAGIDQFGAHLFVIDDPGEATCYDFDGWAAIGSGWRHADQEFIRSKYNRNWDFDAAMLMSYLAKKRADVTPGVGKTTDVFWIGSGTATPYILIPTDHEVMTLMDQLFEDMQKKEEELGENARRRIKDYFESQIEQDQEPATQEQIEPEGGIRAADTEGVRKSTEKRKPKS